MATEGLLEIKQHISDSLEKGIADLMERIEEGLEDDDLETLVAELLSRVRAAAEVTRQVLAVEAEVRTHRDLKNADGANDAQQRLDVLTGQLASLKGHFHV